MGSTRVLIAKDPGKGFDALTKEMARLLDLYEAEVHQDLYRPDVQAALMNRLARRHEAALRQKQLDEGASRKLELLTEE